MSTLVLVLVPAGLVTRMGPDDTPDAGSVTLMAVEVSTVMGASDTPFNVAAVALSRLVPFTVTTVPGRASSVLYDVTVGREGGGGGGGVVPGVQVIPSGSVADARMLICVDQYLSSCVGLAGPSVHA